MWAQILVAVASIAYSRKKQKEIKKNIEKNIEERKGFQLVTEAVSKTLPVAYGRNLIGGNRVYFRVGNEYIVPVFSVLDTDINKQYLKLEVLNIENFYTEKDGINYITRRKAYIKYDSNYSELFNNFIYNCPVFYISNLNTKSPDLIDINSETYAIREQRSRSRLYKIISCASSPNPYIEYEVYDKLQQYTGVDLSHYCLDEEIKEYSSVRLGFQFNPSLVSYRTINFDDAEGGVKNQFLFVQQAICHSEINSVLDCFVDDNDYTNKALNFGQRIDVYKSGGVITKFWVNRGTIYDAQLENRQYALFNDVTYSGMCFKLNRDDPQYNGIPDVKFIIEGKKIKYIRLINNNYSLSNNLVYSTNPALILLDYLMSIKYGRGLSINQIDLESFYKASQICAKIVQRNANVDGKIWRNSGITKRNIPLYECNIILDTEKPVRDNVISILNTMNNADLIWSNGKYKLKLQYPSNFQDIVTVGTLTDNDLIRSVINIKYPSATERMNFCTVKFFNESQDFKEDTVSWPKKESNVYNTFLYEDNFIPLEKTFTEEGITDYYHALAKAEENVRTSRTSVEYAFKMNFGNIFFEPGDVVILNSEIANIQNEYVKIVEMKAEENSIQVLAVKFTVDQFAWNAKDDEIIPIPEKYNFIVRPVENITFDKQSSINMINGVGVLSWTHPDPDTILSYDIYYTEQNANKKILLGNSVGNSFEIYGLKIGNYTFTITAKAIAGKSASATSIISITIPTVTNLNFEENTIQDSDNYAGTLSWNLAANSGIKGYQIFRSSQNVDQGAFVLINQVDSNISKFLVPRTSAPGLYKFGVKTVSNSGELSSLVETEFYDIDYGTAIYPNISVTEELIYSKENIFTNLKIKINSVSNTFVKSYEVQFKKSNSNIWLSLGKIAKVESQDSIIDLQNVEDQYIYNIRSRIINIDNYNGEWSNFNYTVIGKLAIPAQVENFRGNVTGSTILLEWDASPDSDLSHYFITYHPNILFGDYLTSITILEKVPRPATSVIVPGARGKYFIKAVDKTGNKSLIASETIIETNIDSLNNLNQVLTIQEHPNFSGNRTNLIYDNDTNSIRLDLSLFNNSTLGSYYYFNTSADLSEIYNTVISYSYEMYRYDLSNLFDSFGGNFDSRTGLFDGDLYLDDIDAYLEVRYRNNISEPWSSWQKMLISTIKARYFEFRIFLSTEVSTASPNLYSLTVNLDMPDRVVSENDIISGNSSTGYDVVFPNGAFKNIPAIGIATNLNTGDYYNISNKTSSGFNIIFKNSSGTVQSKTFDYVARGYGKVET